MVTARPYQIEAIQKIQQDWSNGFTDVLLTMATGGGKSFVFLSLLDQMLDGEKRGLCIAHRKELIDQPLARLHSYFPAWDSLDGLGRPRAGVVMAEQNQPQAQLVIATVQSLNVPSKAPLSQDKTRLDDVLYYGPVDYLISDECHHSVSDSYLALYAKLRAANPSMKHLGVTATPIRADGDGLGSVFQKESAHYGIVELIKAGWLAPVRWLAIQTRVSLAGVASRAGDYVTRQLANVYEVDNCFDLVVESHKKYADGRQAIAFTVSVEGAYRLAEKFKRAGIPAGAADGTTNKKERAGILADFQAGRSQVLCNVGLYTEGLDVPQASCIHQVRPTKSDGLYIQMVGRSLRTYPGKFDALILDYAPLEIRNIAMMGDVLGCPLRKDSYVEEEAERGDVQAAFTFDGEFGWREGSPAEIIARQLDYLDQSPWSWYRRDGFLTLGLGETQENGSATYIERVLVITPPDQDGRLALYGIWRKFVYAADRRREITQNWLSQQVASGDFTALSLKAEELCNKHGNAALAAKQRSWRREPATDGQIQFARRLPGAFKPGMNKGELAQSITHTLALRAITQSAIGATQ